MSYVTELDQLKTILTNGMTVYAAECDYVTEIESEYPPGGYTADDIVILIKRMPWGADHNVSERWQVFEVIMEDIVNAGEAESETFEKAAAELENIQYTYDGGAATVPYALSITPLTIYSMPNNVRTFRVMMFWSK